MPYDVKYRTSAQQKNKLVHFVVASLCIISANSFAAGWSAYGNVSGVFVDTRPTRSVVMFKHSEMDNPDACSKSDYYELELGATTSEMLYSLLLSSDATQKLVKIYSQGCGPENRPLAVIIAGAS